VVNVIDLSVPLNERTPVYPGDPATVIKRAGVLDRDGFNDHLVSVGTHVGTHIDAPFHMIAGGKTLNQIPIEQFVGRGCYVKVEGNKIDLETVQKVDVREGDIVLLHTGAIEFYHEPRYYSDTPEIPEDVARYLVDKKIKMVGMDMSGPDEEPFKTHKILLSGGVLIIENLTNLDKLAGKDFTVYALPIKLGIDGAPARVIAQIK
jgi:kynurenine formamidase